MPTKIKTVELKNHFADPLDFKTINFLKLEEVSSIHVSQMELRDKLKMSACIAQLDLMILYKLNEGGYGNEHILIPGIEFKNESMVCIRREEVVEEYAKRGISIEFILAPPPKAGEKVTRFRFGINVDVHYYIKFKLKE